MSAPSMEQIKRKAGSIRNQQGEISMALVFAVVMSVCFVGALIFGFWALGGMQDYKKNSDAKSAVAAAAAVKSAEAKKDADFAEQEKSPVKTYSGSPTYGTVVFSYPKNYSAYVIESSSGGSTPLDGYFNPNVVPGTPDSNKTYGLRFQVASGSYDNALKQFDSQIKSGKLTAKAFRAAKVNSALGTRLDGEISTGKQGALVLLPLRDKTLKIWTEAREFVPDFDTYVLPNLSFSP